LTALVLQLQESALDSSTPVAEVLRKAKVVAAKLDLSDFKLWVERELDGYPDQADIPDYREASGSLKFWNPVRGWCPIVHDGSLARLCTVKIGQPIGSLEDVVSRTSKGRSLQSNIPDRLQSQLCEQIGFATQVHLFHPVSAAVGILDAVRNKVLDWSLKLEKAKILGEGMRFTEIEKKEARNISSANQYFIQNVGVLGDVSGSNSITSNQSVNYSKKDFETLRGILVQVEQQLDHFGGDEKKEIAAAVTEMKAELAKPHPNPTKLQKTIRTIRNVCEGVAGSLIASGILALTASYAS